MCSCAGVLCVACPAAAALGHVGYEPLEEEPRLEGSNRRRRDTEGSGGGYLDYLNPEDDDEDQEYYSSTEIMPSREPGELFKAYFIPGNIF